MAKLVIEKGTGIGREVDLPGPLVIGREGDLEIDDPKSSRQHCRISPAGDGFALADLDSRNGTLVNGNRVSQHPLRHGDQIRIGNTVLRFVDAAAAPDELVLETAATAEVDLPGPGRAAAPAGRRPAAGAPPARPAGPARPAAASPGRAAAPAAAPAAGGTAASGGAPPKPARPPIPLASDGEITFTDGREGALWEDLGQRNFAYKALMVLLALAIAGGLFAGVMLLSEKMFR